LAISAAISAAFSAAFSAAKSAAAVFLEPCNRYHPLPYGPPLEVLY